MKNNAKKIGLFALVAIMLVVSVVSFGVFATDENEPGVEILYNNLEYGSNISILYATRVSGAAEGSEIRMDFYTLNEGVYTLSYSEYDYYNDDVVVNDVTENLTIFHSSGIAPKHMPEIVYAQAVLTVDGVEYKSNLSRFSIVEYCYKRLYKDVKVTDDQKALYNHILGYGTYAQKVLEYNLDDTPAHYFYVNAQDANIDSVNINGNEYNFSTGIFKADKEILLKHASLSAGEYANWKVNFIANDGTVTSQSVIDGYPVTISDKHIVAAPVVEIVTIDFEDFDSTTAVYDKNILTNADKDISSNIVYNEVSDDGLSYKYAQIDVVEDPVNSENNALLLKATYNNSIKTNVSETKIDLMAGTEGNLYTFTTDLYIANSAITSGSNFGFTFANENSSKIYANTVTTAKVNDAHAPIFFSSNSCGQSSYKEFGCYLPYGKWFNLKIEIYHNTEGYVDASGNNLTYTAKYYVNDYFIGDDFAYNTSASPIEYVKIHLTRENPTIYLDNISFIRSNGTFKEGPTADAKQFPALEAGAQANGTGLYFADETKVGYRNDYNTFSRENAGAQVLNNNSAYANAYRTNDNYIYYEKIGSASDAHTSIKYFVDANTLENAYQVIEFDAAFNSDRSSFFVVSARGNGVANSIFFSANADGTIRLDNPVNASTVFNEGYSFNSELERVTIQPNKWHNIRFEIYKDAIKNGSKNVGLVRVFVDGVEYQSLIGVDANTSSSNYVNLSLRAADDNAWISYDNIFIGYDEITAE